MTKTEINKRAAEIENSVAQGEAMLKAQYEAFEKALIDYRSFLDAQIAAQKELVGAYQKEAKALHKELLKLKNRENKPKRTWPITNYTIARKIGISETQLIVRLMKLGVMHKDWGALEVYSDWKGFLRFVSMPTAKSKYRNVWQWTPEGRDKFMEIHNKTNF